MKSPEYPILRAEKDPTKIEQAPNVPIIDIIRHGETERKQSAVPPFRKLNTKVPDFKLTKEFLDLTQEGIEDIEQTARQILEVIDKDNEVVFIASSPAWRTHSSALVFEKVLRENGVNVINKEGEPKFFEGINQDNAHFSRVWERTSEEDKERVSVGKKAFELENLNFNRFIRHMGNIYRWLKPETLERLKGKKLRIIAFAHQETSTWSLEEIFPERNYPGQHKGQILEIIPSSELSADGEVVTDIKLYPQYSDKGAEAQVIRGFRPKE